jgi:hypothetical protein
MLYRIALQHVLAAHHSLLSRVPVAPTRALSCKQVAHGAALAAVLLPLRVLLCAGVS